MVWSARFLGVLVALGIAMVPALSSAMQQPIESRTLLEDQIDLVPDMKLCWDVRRGSLAAGSASPASGYQVHGWVVNYVVEGIEHFVYEDGREGIIGPGEAALFEADTPHRHESIGTGPRVNIAYELSCDPLPNSVANTGVIPGVEPGLHQIQVRERTWAPGAQTPVHIVSGPTTTYVLEGTIGRSLASGIDCPGPGEIYVSPVGELAQNTNIGDIPARTLDVDVWPVGETRTVPQTGVVLPSAAAPGACPRFQ